MTDILTIVKEQLSKYLKIKNRTAVITVLCMFGEGIVNMPPT